MRNVFINKVQLAFGNEEGTVSLCLNDDTTKGSVHTTTTTTVLLVLFALCYV